MHDALLAITTQDASKTCTFTRGSRAFHRSTIQTGDPDETESNYSSAYSSKSDSVTPVDSFSELSDGSLDERGRQASQVRQVHAAKNDI